jgi:bacteriocin biosynthesis cyclodehydratase domain-containing protein
MDNDIPGVEDARYSLLGVQVIPHGGGVVLRRGATRVFLEGEGVGELVDLILARAAEGQGIKPADLWASLSGARRGAFSDLIRTLTERRFLVAFDETVTGANEDGSNRKEEIFFWNHGTNFAAVTGALASVDLVVFGVNHVGLALLGNLRGCGFRGVTLVDHPTLRNLDFYDPTGELRLEIASALPVTPKLFENFGGKSGASPSCYVVCSDFGGLALMRDWNRHCVENGILFYPVVLQETVSYLGPLVVPEEGPCFECMWSRRASNLADPARELAIQMQAFHGQRVVGYLQAMARVAADLAAIDLLKYFSAALPGGIAGRLIEADLMAPSIKARNVLKVPRCPVCSRLRQSSASFPVEETVVEPEPVAEGG